VDTKYFTIDGGSNGQVVKKIRELLPNYLSAILALTLCEESINLRCLSSLMITSEECESSGVP
jgi:hypothetical protein